MEVTFNYAIVIGSDASAAEIDDCIDMCTYADCVEFSYDRFDRICTVSVGTRSVPVMKPGTDYYVECVIGTISWTHIQHIVLKQSHATHMS